MKFRPLGLLLPCLLLLEAAMPSHAQETAGSGLLYPILVDGKWGFISEAGDVITPPSYDSLQGLRFPFPGCTDLRYAPNVLGADGPVAVAVSSGHVGMKWGFVGPSGEIVPPVYDMVYGFRDGVAAVSRDGKWGFIDATGAEVISFNYDYASGFREGASVVMVDGWWGLIADDGNYIVEPVYDIIRFLTHGPYLMFETRGKQGVLHASGEMLADAQFDQVHVVSEDLVNVVVEGKAGYFNVASNEWQIEPSFDGAAPFGDGVAEVRLGNAAGFIDRSGNFTVEPREPNKRLMSNFGQFHFEGGKLSPIRKYIDVKRRQQVVGLIDTRSGEVLIEPVFTSIGMVYEGRAVFEDAGKFGYLDEAGNIAIPALFKQATDFSGGLAYVTFEDGSGYIDPEGRMAITFDDKRLRGSPFRPDLAFVYGDGRERYVNQDGVEIYSFASGCN
ncbi:WG repeat-containing protein [Shimia aestuarii]|uniref:WG containing repeat-containing protein n=1 Tax=Shimia aestuarii TaxID=254406 RepID=A0A1I4MWK0_9RHOB|nr:WG repeat-containing protein [Shimia aestuarii]SFM07692.1 WG containing repeat-containing protein [Shimia aestuarii]